jgi:dihydroorotase/N-acyl-D-amino-acid deacylase
MNKAVLTLLTCLGLQVVAGCAHRPAAPEFTIVLTGGTVYTGGNAEGVVADVWIRGDRIAGIGDLGGGSAVREIDVSGLVIAPGFIDIHSHAVRSQRDRSGIFTHPEAENYIRQGVTTIIGGPDGSSEWPIRKLLDDLEAAPPSVNFGTFVGHNTIREEVMGREDRAPSVEELQAMREMVDRGMREGAFGLSTGLKYIPGAYSKTEEVIELARVAGAHGGIHISHMREEGLDLLKSVEETIRIGEEGGLPTQLTHHKAVGQPMWGSSSETLAMVDAAVARGVDVSIDQYPYTASSTGISVLFPAWSLAGDRDTQLARLHDPEIRMQIKEAIVYNIINDRGGNDPARVFLADCDWDSSLNGKNLAEVLREREHAVSIEAAAELAMELQENGGCFGVFHAMSEEDVIRIMQHPRTMIGSDGGIHVPGEGVPHPRNYGAFARVLGAYVREQGVFPLQTAIHKMTRMPADRIGLAGRGRIEPGAIADIAVFDPAEVRDNATFEDPHRYASGMVHVFVAGQAVLLNGELTGARPGRILRSRPVAQGD